MMSVLNWIWTRGILSTFMAGVFVLLPIALTVTVISGWAPSYKYWVNHWSGSG